MKHRDPWSKDRRRAQVVLRPLMRIAEEIAGIAVRTGCEKSDVTT